MNEILKKDNPKLPPSGLADEILTDNKKNLKGESEEGVYGGTFTETERIYAFADQLGKDKKEEKDGKTEEELEIWVTFSLANESFGLPVSNVREILRAGTITQVPHAPHPVRGVTNIRGRVLPVVDLRARLGLQESKLDQLSRILVVEAHGRLIGLLVDSVQQVIRLNRKAIQPAPPDVMTAQSDYILGVYHLQELLVILLDVNRVLLIKDSLQKEALAGAK
jgi:purine-binding chemotaxis protein CheW